MENREVELRAFLSAEQYAWLHDFFSREAVFAYEDNQISYYLSGDHDLRLQENDRHAKIWMKKWSMHDETREEIEIPFDKKDFAKMKALFMELWYEVTIIRKRKRLQYVRWDIDVSLDDTQGYGYILELEILCGEAEQEQKLLYLREKFQRLGIAVTAKELFQEKYDRYKHNRKNVLSM